MSATELAPVRWSHLKNMCQSPAHYRYRLEHPISETPAMRIGTYVHKLLLGGPRLVEVYPGDRRGKAWEEFDAAYGKIATVLNRSEGETASRIANAVMEHKQAMELLYSGAREETISWVQTGRVCVGTPDVASASVLVDLKVTVSADPKILRWHAIKMLWHAQLAWYANALSKINGFMPADIYIVAAESKPPYPVTILHMQPSAIMAGEAVWASCFSRLLQCEASGDWPAYSSVPVPFEAPSQDDLLFASEEEDA